MASSAEDKSKPATCQPQPSKPVTGHPQMQSGCTAGNPPVYPGYHPYTAPYYNFRRSRFCQGFLITLIALIIISFVISFFTWPVLRPQVPTFRIDSLAVSNFNRALPNPQLTANLDVWITTRNPNKELKVFCDRLETYVLYEGTRLGMTLIPPFYVGKEKQETMHGKLAVDSKHLNELVAGEMAGDRSSSSVSFSVRMIVRARFGADGLFTRRRSLRVFCENMKVMFLDATGSGKFTDAPMACTVYV